MPSREPISSPAAASAFDTAIRGRVPRVVQRDLQADPPDVLQHPVDPRGHPGGHHERVRGGGRRRSGPAAVGRPAGQCAGQKARGTPSMRGSAPARSTPRSWSSEIASAEPPGPPVCGGIRRTWWPRSVSPASVVGGHPLLAAQLRRTADDVGVGAGEHREPRQRHRALRVVAVVEQVAEHLHVPLHLAVAARAVAGVQQPALRVVGDPGVERVQRLAPGSYGVRVPLDQVGAAAEPVVQQHAGAGDRAPGAERERQRVDEADRPALAVDADRGRGVPADRQPGRARGRRRRPRWRPARRRPPAG